MTNKILIIGKPHSGKTTFIAQIYAKLDVNESLVKLYKTVENLTPISESLKRLANGEEVTATPTDKNTEIILPIEFDGKKIDLCCPDYGGEQVNNIIADREVNDKWKKSIKECDNWILFIRPTNVSSDYDLSNKTINAEVLENGTGEAEQFVISDQSGYIELLQIMLYIKEQDAHFRSKTKLTVVLTCWDEIESPLDPIITLEKSLPLFLNFINSNWEKGYFKILGLSSLGFSLKELENKEKYQAEGSENFGFIILEDGTNDGDITQLITQSL